MAQPSDPARRRDIVVIGGSAGAVNALLHIAAGLTPNLEAALFVVIHQGATASGGLPDLIDRAGPLRSAYADDGETIQAGRIYLARPDLHLLIQPGIVRLAHGPKENRFRPAIDPLFRTAARTYGPRVVGVLLSGALDDGVHGLSLVKSLGGKAIVQDPHEAPMPELPISACRNVDVDYIVPSAEISALLASLANEPATGKVRNAGAAMDPDDQLEPDVAEQGTHGLVKSPYRGAPSVFRCPECGGPLWEMEGGRPVRFRCHVGHSFTGEGLLEEQQQSLEAAMWTAVRTLDENAALNRRMSERAREMKLKGLVMAYDRRAQWAQQQADVIRRLLVSQQKDSIKSKPVPHLRDQATR